MDPDFNELLAERQTSLFVGRGQYLARFRNNLSIPPTDRRARFIFNLHGQGGMGKTTLLTEFKRAAEASEWLTGWTDENEDDVVLSLARIVDGFGGDKYFASFISKYDLYKQRLDDLRAEPDIPEDLAGLIARAVGRGAVVFGRRIPVAGAALDLVDPEAAGSVAVEWISYLGKKLGTREEVELIRDPVAELSPLFVQGLREIYADGRRALIAIDTYEQSGRHLDWWLRQMLTPRFGRLTASFILAIAGRDPLDANNWAGYRAVTESWRLDEFTDAEARELLGRFGVADERVVSVILEVSGGLPLFVATLGAETPDNPTAVGDPSGPAVERFLKWSDESHRRPTALNASMPRRFDLDVLGVLVEDPVDALAWLRSMPFVQERSRGWVYHDVVRPAMLRQKRLESEDAWRDSHRNLAKLFEERRDRAGKRFEPSWQEPELERVYHGLAEAPDTRLAQAVAMALVGLRGAPSFGRGLAVAIQDAGRDAQHTRTEEMGRRLLELAHALQGDDYEAAIDLFFRLETDGELEWSDKGRKALLRLRGEAAYAARDSRRAVADASALVERDPDNDFNWYMKARALSQMKDTAGEREALNEAIVRSDKDAERRSGYLVMRASRNLEEGDTDLALADLEAAEALFDGGYIHLARGDVLRRDGRLDESLAEFQRALDLDPSLQHPVLRAFGEVYIERGETEEAVTALVAALEAQPACTYCWEDLANVLVATATSPKDVIEQMRALEFPAAGESLPRAIACRGLALIEIGQGDAGFEDLSAALDLSPNDPWMLAHRGEAYFMVKDDYAAALADLSEALRLKPRYLWALTLRGHVNITSGEAESALRDLSRVLELDRSNVFARAFRGQARAQLQLFDKALEDLTRALELSPSVSWIRVERARVYVHMERFDDAISDYARAFDDDEEILEQIVAEWGLVLTYRDKFNEALAVFEKGLAAGLRDLALAYNIAVATARKDGLEAAADAINAVRAELEVAEGQEALCYARAGVAALEGDADAALSYLERAFADGNSARRWARFDRAFDEIRQRDDFQALLGLGFGAT